LLFTRIFPLLFENIRRFYVNTSVKTFNGGAMRRGQVCCVTSLLFAGALFFAAQCYAQTTDATVTGEVTDQSGKLVPGTTVLFTNINTGVSYTAQSNGSGIYTLPNLPPGIYRANVTKVGFKSVVKSEIELHVQDQVSINFDLQVGSVSETVTVEGGAPLLNTESATVSTVVDRNFAENLPMNGRSFQTLIQLTPGVVVIPSNAHDGGQFSVNGQRGESNYWTVDGVSANIGIGVSSSGTPGNGFGGALGSFSVLGGTNSLVSVDALQEFRIQTSTYAPEFGRTPGGQISILTRSGTNQFHGTLFDYFRNDILDANYWFNTSVRPALAKAKERQNDFGGTFSGPILKDRTFFFFSYEGLRLRLPQTTLTTVPDVSARRNAIAAVQPFLNAFPLPNGPDDVTTGVAQLNASYSNPATLDAYSIRIDHRLNDKFSLFGRYNYSPSELDQRGAGTTLSSITSSRITTQTATLGGTMIFSPATTNDLRFNYSRVNASSRSDLDNFGGAVPLSSLPFPSPFTSRNANFSLDIFSLTNNASFLNVGPIAKNLQSQINIVDSLSSQRGAHSLKFGVDFRRLSPLSDPPIYVQAPDFFDVPSAEVGNLGFASVLSARRTALLFKNLGVFVQDTWRVGPRLTITYGLRWDVDFAPSSTSGPSLPAVTGYNLKDLSNLALAPAGTPPFNTRYANIAPRLGLAYQVSQSQEWQTVLRGGFGVFYDLATSQAGNAFSSCCYPYGSFNVLLGPPSGGTSTFPLSPTDASPPAIVPPNASNGQTLAAFDPHLRLPYTLEWNVAVEQALGKQQSISASYIGSSGRRLLQAADIASPSPDLAQAILFGNTATSEYNALQLQFERRMSRGLQALASYTWSHSIDDGSAGSYGISSNDLPGALSGNANRGPSDFDIRHTFSVGVTYDLPAPKINTFTSAILRGWSLQSFILARSAPPVDVSDVAFSRLNPSGAIATIRPDLVPGQPLYLLGSQCIAVFGSPCPGGKGFNPAAFTDPPVDPVTMLPTRQGNLGRNALRGFGATQWDFGVHRDFPIHESVKLQFRAEMFNVLNHPNFGSPNSSFVSPQFGGPVPGFGVSTQMLGQSLSGGFGGNLGGGAFSPLYQLGGPRSVQFALKLVF
jgi:hypothetical protein